MCLHYNVFIRGKGKLKQHMITGCHSWELSSYSMEKRDSSLRCYCGPQNDTHFFTHKLSNPPTLPHTKTQVKVSISKFPLQDKQVSSCLLLTAPDESGNYISLQTGRHECRPYETAGTLLRPVGLRRAGAGTRTHSPTNTLVFSHDCAGGESIVDNPAICP